MLAAAGRYWLDFLDFLDFVGSLVTPGESLYNAFLWRTWGVVSGLGFLYHFYLSGARKGDPIGSPWGMRRSPWNFQ